MSGKMTKRSLVRIVSFSIAIFLVVLFWALSLFSRANQAELSLEYNYLRAIEDLSQSADNINKSLQKGMYASSSQMLGNISNDLILESTNAKNCISQLSTPELSLEGANKFLSQVGNFSESLAKKLESDKKITDKEYELLSKLYEYSKSFKDNLWEIENMISQSGDELSYQSVSVLSKLDDESVADNESIGTSFYDIEDGFEDYPTLIYDGPYSDHLIDKTPEMTKGKESVTVDDARKRASEVSQVQEKSLTLSNNEDGKMPSFIFEGNNATVAVTKKGGFCSYMIKSRDVNKTSIKNDEAVSYAKAYLSELGIYEMESTYFETIQNVCTINFAYVKNDVMYYTDLIKVKVALDNGEILGFDARGFIVNHKDRALENPKIEVVDAQDKLSPKLTVQKVKKALIPLDTGEETLCYEFKCVTQDKQNILVYVNCATGEEEQILILLETESGTLTV